MLGKSPFEKGGFRGFENLQGERNFGKRYNGGDLRGPSRLAGKPGAGEKKAMSRTGVTPEMCEVGKRTRATMRRYTNLRSNE